MVGRFGWGEAADEPAREDARPTVIADMAIHIENRHIGAGRAGSPLPAALLPISSVQIHHAGAHGVTRPTLTRCRFPSSLANCANVN